MEQVFSVDHFGFRPYTLAGFTEIVALEWKATGYYDHQFDNLVLSVAQPLEVQDLNFGNVLTPFTVTSSTPANRAVLPPSSRQVELVFNFNLDPASLAAADVTIDGVAVPGVRIDPVSGNILRVDLPTLAVGSHTLAIAPGAIQSQYGTPNSTYSLSFLTPVDLGVVDYRDVQDVNPAGGEVWYYAQTAHPGLMTLQAFPTEISQQAQVEIFDSQFHQITFSSLWGTSIRIGDIPFPTVGTGYYVRVSGTSANVDLRLINLFQHVGNKVTVYGTAGDDQFEFDATLRRVAIKGVPYDLDTAVTSIAFDGGEGRNAALLTGSAANEIFVIRAPVTTFLGSGITVSVSNTSDIIAESGGGQDLARLYDSAGDDTFEAHPTYAVLKANNASYSYRANGFAFVQAYASSGNDTADLYDSAGKDAFTCDLGKKYGELSGTGFYVRANSFPSLTAHASTGDDIARFYDSPGDDQFESFPTYATMSGGGLTGRAENFRYFLGYSTSGNDKATLHDSPQAETYVGAPTWGILFNPSSCYSRVTNFKTTEVLATPGADDLARLYDGPGDDQLVAYPGDVTFAGPGLSQHVLGFRFVQAYATAGGTDQAHFYDSAGQDTFEAHPGTASMQSADYLNRASNFASYRAYSLLGGGDVAKFYDTPGDDTFDGFLSYATMSGQAYSARADGFANVLAYATAGGTDTANFHGTSGAESFLGMSGISRMSNSSYSQTASAFDKVYFLSGGGSDTALVYDTPGDDRLETGADWARFTSAEQMLYLSALSNTASVKAYGVSGGTNTKRVAATDYALETYGTWIDEGP